MPKHLVIVESPAKGKTIEKYLGKDYQVLASYGHVRDLPKTKLGVEPENGFAPSYVIPAKAKKVIATLKKALEKSDALYLATDYDREGEAIAWHVAEALKPSKKTPVYRITFHEITKSAITEAVQKPRELDMDLVNAQQARRVLDRLVGYTLSPFLWKKVMKGLSAGRVQSVAVRLVVDREAEITAFKPVEYWSIDAELLADGTAFKAGLSEYQGKKIEKLSVGSGAEAHKIEQALKDAAYTVRGIESKEQAKRPSPPFTTSTLQQQASHRLHLSAKATMKLAQDLYEAGHITYMRTDSTNLANEAIGVARDFVGKTFGAEYLPEAGIHYKTKARGAQEAHEAIRPTDPAKRAADLNLESDRHARLYELIWQRMVACQMAPARVLVSSIDIQAGETATFRATGSVVIFPGYLKVWPSDRSDTILPKLEQGQSLELRDLHAEQHFTEPPARYSEATLVKALEENGIGRPSTYAPTLSTIQDRGYVELVERRFKPTETGTIVTKLLTEHFPDIVNLEFTAHMEDDLDQVAEGKEGWEQILGQFWKTFEPEVKAKTKSVEKVDMTEELDRMCPECKKHNLIIRTGRFGKFIACPGFPDCRYTEKIVQKVGVQCPECSQGELTVRKTRKGKTFWGCERYPDCKYATWDDPLKAKKKAEESDESKVVDVVPTE
ncbi:type I DNA topoisomerase [Candidatus Berkelbacteria bacterium]|nr:type I DNA topoisomerase [Candidatus Berkelbacteria bacterium]